MTKPTVNICWLRRDIRLRDNHALYRALEAGRPVLVIFIFDKNILSKLSDPKDKRLTFIHNSLSDLNEEMQRYHSSLYAVYDTPLHAFQVLLNQFEAQEVFANHDYEPYALARDREVLAFLHEKQVPFHNFKDQVIFEKSEIIKPDRSPYTVFTPYSNRWKQLYRETATSHFPSEKKLSGLFTTAPFPFPALTDMGFETVSLDGPRPQLDKNLLETYQHTRELPFISGTSQVSTDLRFGLVSVRELVRLAEQYSETWLDELIWREFFMMILFHFPRVVDQSFKQKYDLIPWRNDEGEFERWCRGETGFPIVDAGMRQLNETGWMHNRVRMIVASFLVKHLLIDWRWGEAYFAGKLLDYELASNNGNWQWAAGSGCDAVPYFRIFNPWLQAKKFDPEEKYVKRWIDAYPENNIPPMVDHEFARKRALETYNKALKI